MIFLSYGKISRPSPSTRLGLSVNCTTCQATVSLVEFEAPAERVRVMAPAASADFQEVSSRSAVGVPLAGSALADKNATLLLVTMAGARVRHPAGTAGIVETFPDGPQRFLCTVVPSVILTANQTMSTW